jgi:hypothetical protein
MTPPGLSPRRGGETKETIAIKIEKINNKNPVFTLSFGEGRVR